MQMATQQMEMPRSLMANVKKVVMTASFMVMEEKTRMLRMLETMPTTLGTAKMVIKTTIHM